jgi:hypothetical protein
MSKSANLMLEEAQDVVYLYAMEFILDKATTRISRLHEWGVVSSVKSITEKVFDTCDGFEVIQLEDNGMKFKIT